MDKFTPHSPAFYKAAAFFLGLWLCKKQIRCRALKKVWLLFHGFRIK